MIVRQTYLEKLKLMRDKKIIKVITGVRRSGKSTLLEMYRDFFSKQRCASFMLSIYKF